MKMISSLILGTLTMITVSAQAYYRPNWERPILRADLSIEEATGIFKNTRTVELTLNKRDGNQTATSFTLKLDGSKNPIELAIDRVESVGCGSVKYTAMKVGGMSIQLIDHTQRLCMDYQPFAWRGQIGRVASPQYSGSMKVVGNPTGVITPQ
jgi:hypothetical protein